METCKNGNKRLEGKFVSKFSVCLQRLMSSGNGAYTGESSFVISRHHTEVRRFLNNTLP
jgi:hypothetical protein